MQALPFTRRLLTGLTVLALAGYMSGSALGAVVFESREAGEGRVVIDGTSNVKDWDVAGEDVRGRIELPPLPDGPAAALPERFLAVTPAAQIRIPVRSLTGESRGMDRRMRSSLEADDHPMITFNLKELHPPQEREEPAELPEGAVRFLAEGELTIAGATKTVRVPTTVTPAEDGGVRIEGRLALKMSDFGIDPPRALLGALRTGDEVTVSVTWTPGRENP